MVWKHMWNGGIVPRILNSGTWWRLWSDSLPGRFTQRRAPPVGLPLEYKTELATDPAPTRWWNDQFVPLSQSEHRWCSRCRIRWFNTMYRKYLLLTSVTVLLSVCLSVCFAFQYSKSLSWLHHPMLHWNMLTEMLLTASSSCSYLSRSWATCWPVSVSRVQESLQWSSLVTSSCKTCQWLKSPLNGLRAQTRVSPVVGLLTLASGQAWFGMVFTPFLMKQLHRRDSVVIVSYVGTGYTTRRLLIA
jgi:hypothetical protein